MNRYLLDTNILVFILFDELDNLSDDVRKILGDYYSRLYTSTICMSELFHLCRIGKLHLKRGWSMEGLAGLLKDHGVEIADFTKKHTQTLSVLETIDGHNDPNDFAIISQAITDRYTLISSDRKFKEYIPQNLSFIFNKR
ncbi:type II toxin-antitoxin system VapC family toxin [Leadbetterella sp. DM7]|uniref:type II toxin-antitoxin system VapC family toxin n=1 Tax=Leadbetterella sp. DM7 TaxID=3235085 RepID=UPI00349EF5A3